MPTGLLDRHRLTIAFLLGLALGLSFLECSFFWLAWLVPGLVLMLGAGQPGKTAFRYWQEGPGCDRNLATANAALASIDYLHLNPVRRGLVQAASDWRWSSCRFYLSEGQTQDEAIPKIHGLPVGFLD